MENNQNKALDLPQSEEKITVPVKFNKEMKELSLDEAAVLAQKGLKFEAIEEDFATLKDLAAKENKSVPLFISEIKNRLQENKKQSLIEECGGNQELAERILRLEGGDKADFGFEELQKAFPEIKTPEDLPDEVLEKSRLKGTLPLDEYLRYLLKEKRRLESFAEKQREAEASSTGSLADLRDTATPETEEFLRGLWR